MNSILKAYEEINKVKSVVGGNLKLDKIMEDMNNIKIANAYVDICNGVKSDQALASNKINKNMVKNYAGVNSLYFASKGNKDYSPKTSLKSNPNKGKKLVRNGDESYYISKAEYNELLKAGKIKEKSNKKKITKSKTLRNGVSISNTGYGSSTEKDYSDIINRTKI